MSNNQEPSHGKQHTFSNLVYPIVPLYLWILMIDFSRFISQTPFSCMNSQVIPINYSFLLPSHVPLDSLIHLQRWLVSVNVYVKRLVVCYCCWKIATWDTDGILAMRGNVRIVLMKMVFGVIMWAEIAFVMDKDHYGILLFMLCQVLLVARFIHDIWHLMSFAPNHNNKVVATSSTESDPAQDLTTSNTLHHSPQHPFSSSSLWLCCLVICVFLFTFQYLMIHYIYSPLQATTMKETPSSTSNHLLFGISLYCFLLACSTSLSVISFFQSIIHTRCFMYHELRVSQLSYQCSLFSMLGMILLYMCDICVGFDLVLKKGSNEWLWANSFIWVFYVPSLICLTWSSCGCY